jgi:hypothetical protein
MVHGLYGITAFGMFIWGIFIGQMVMLDKHKCRETLPKEITETFTFKNDTLFVKQGTNFTISTKTMTLDTAGIIYRNR